MATRPRRSVRGPRLDGARDLDDLLIELDVSVPDFCEQKGLDRLLMQRALAGDNKSVPLDFALAVQKATDGRISVHRWATSTRRDDDDEAPPESRDSTPERDRASGE